MGPQGVVHTGICGCGALSAQFGVLQLAAQSAALCLLLILSYRRASEGFKAGNVFTVSATRKPSFPRLYVEPRLAGEDRRLVFISVTVRPFIVSQAFYCFPSDDMAGIQPMSL